MLILTSGNANDKEILTLRLSDNQTILPSIFNTCLLFSQLAIEIWERINFAYSTNGFKVYETTITQNLLFQLEKARKHLHLNFLIREAIDEKANGNDIEFVLKSGNKCLKLPMQAKRVKKNLRYSSFSHKTQIDDLISYAKKENGIPLYLLYNFNRNFSQKVKLCSIDSDQREYGCSLIDAYYIRDNFTHINSNNSRSWNIPIFNDLVPNPSKPWIVLPCCLGNFNTKGEVFEQLGISPDQRKQLDYLSLHDCKDVLKEKKWRDFTLGGENDIYKEDQDESVQNTYNPKYQIVIGNI